MANLRRFAGRLQAKEESNRHKEHEEEYRASLRKLSECEEKHSKNFFHFKGSIFLSASFASKDKIQEDEQPLLTKIRQ